MDDHSFLFPAYFNRNFLNFFQKVTSLQKEKEKKSEADHEKNQTFSFPNTITSIKKVETNSQSAVSRKVHPLLPLSKPLTNCLVVPPAHCTDWSPHTNDHHLISLWTQTNRLFTFFPLFSDALLPNHYHHSTIPSLSVDGQAFYFAEFPQTPASEAS